jgi:enamine deaminase RidA (YjgF/YER057c/UK114 family)
VKLIYPTLYLHFKNQPNHMPRQNILSGSPWEDKMGYCRAVRIGNIVEVAGTVAIVDGEKVKADDAFAQTNNIIERIAKVLEEAGAGLSDVIRTRIFTTDISRFDEIARAHGAYFGEIKPTTGIYEISKLVSPDYLVEIEFTAIVQ